MRLLYFILYIIHIITARDCCPKYGLFYYTVPDEPPGQSLKNLRGKMRHVPHFLGENSLYIRILHDLEMSIHYQNFNFTFFFTE